MPTDRERQAERAAGAACLARRSASDGARQVQPGHDPRRRAARPMASIARSKASCGAAASMRTLVSQPRAGHPLHPRSERRSSSSDAVAGALWSSARPLSPVGTRQERRATVGQQVDVGLDALGAGLAEGQDPQRDPRVVGRDRDVDRRAVADRLAALGGRVGVEDGGEEDRAARGVEVEDLGRVGREPEAVVRGPRADLVGAALEDGDVERVDPDLHEDLGAVARPRPPAASARRSGLRLGLADEALERPVAALLDARRDARGAA